MCVTICGRFYSDEGIVVGYDNRSVDRLMESDNLSAHY
ncbi:DUF6783 domain-containing protein [Blautia sp. HCP3S3_D9]